MAICMTNDLFQEALKEGTPFQDLELLYSKIGNPSSRIRKIKEDLNMTTSQAVDFLLGIEYHLSSEPLEVF